MTRYDASRSKRIGLIFFFAIAIVPILIVVVACFGDGNSCPPGQHLVNKPGGKYQGGGWVCVR